MLRFRRRFEPHRHPLGAGELVMCERTGSPTWWPSRWARSGVVVCAVRRPYCGGSGFVRFRKTCISGGEVFVRKRTLDPYASLGCCGGVFRRGRALFARCAPSGRRIEIGRRRQVDTNDNCHSDVRQNSADVGSGCCQHGADPVGWLDDKNRIGLCPSRKRICNLDQEVDSAT